MVIVVVVVVVVIIVVLVVIVVEVVAVARFIIYGNLFILLGLHMCLIITLPLWVVTAICVATFKLLHHTMQLKLDIQC
jgi:hypothetical protein